VNDRFCSAPKIDGEVMLYIKRFGTAIVLFMVLFIFLFFGSLVVGGAMAGARAGSEHPGARNFQTGYEIGRQAGAEFGRRYGALIFLGALGVSGLVAVVLPFSGVLPWCRSFSERPKLA
jgi:hypothetical protein